MRGKKVKGEVPLMSQWNLIQSITAYSVLRQIPKTSFRNATFGKNGSKDERGAGLAAVRQPSQSEPHKPPNIYICIYIFTHTHIHTYKIYIHIHTYRHIYMSPFLH